MAEVTTFSETVAELVRGISHRREQIKEDFIKTWLAVNVPDEHMTVEWIVNNVEVVETWTDDRTSVSWHLRKRTVQEREDE